VGQPVGDRLPRRAAAVRQRAQSGAGRPAGGAPVQRRNLGQRRLRHVAAGAGEDEPSLDWAQGALVYVLLGMLLALLAEFAIAPRIVSRENLKLWHSLGTLAYAAQWLCALVVLWKLAGSPASPPSRG
jgi:hypothetical protein